MTYPEWQQLARLALMAANRTLDEAASQSEHNKELMLTCVSISAYIQMVLDQEPKSVIFRDNEV